MSTSLFSRLFPPPQYLTMPAVGLDVSDRALKFVRLDSTTSGLKLEAYGERALPADVIHAGEIKNQPAFVEILKAAKEDWKLDFVYAALPEERGFIFKVDLPNIPVSQWRESIELQLEEHVPLPAAAVVADYEPAAGTGEEHTALVSALPRELVTRHEAALQAAGLRPLAFEIEAMAVARALVPRGEREPLLIVDLGRSRASFSLIVAGQVRFTSTLSQLGGETLTYALAKTFNLTEKEAEKLKLEQGLLAGTDEARRFAALVPALSVIRDEVLKLETFWRLHVGHSQKTLARVICCGAEVLLPGLVEYLASQLARPVEIGNIWTNVLDLDRRVPILPRAESLRYATAIGLALRQYHYD